MHYTSVEDCEIISIGSIRRDPRFEQEDEDNWVFYFGGQEPQDIATTLQAVTFGWRRYFVCACGYKAAKLYLPPQAKEFRCRTCHSLKYRLSSVNSSSIAGRAIYRFSRMNKLADDRANMSRIFYRGKYTKRYGRFLIQCDKAGFPDIVADAAELLKVVRSHTISTKAEH